MPEHHLDRRMRRTAAPRQDRQLHSHLLTPSQPPPPRHFVSISTIYALSESVSVIEFCQLTGDERPTIGWLVFVN